MSAHLNLYYEEKLVGVLSEDEQERLSFKYSKEWLEDDQSFSISVALRLVDETFDHIKTKSFFENLLPEGEVKNSIEQLSHKNVSDEFGFLKEFGIDCSGAFILTPSDHLKSKDKFKSKEIKLSTIYEYLRDKRPLSSTIINEDGGRFSLAGAQDKFPVIYKRKKLYIPLDGEPTTHILKPYIRYHKGTEDTPYNEHFCMCLAKSIGLDVPKTILLEGEFPLYLIERFDRESVNGKIKRIHQQDFCQAQGLTSRKKYEEDGGPTFAMNYKLIADTSSLPIKDLSKLLKWFYFNLLIGNNDCHSKNLSILHTEEGLRLSPFYDILSTSIYKGLTSKFSYKIGGQLQWYKLKERNFELLADEIGINVSVLYREAKHVISKFETKLEAEVLRFNSNFQKIETANIIGKEIKKRIDHLRINIKNLS